MTTTPATAADAGLAADVPSDLPSDMRSDLPEPPRAPFSERRLVLVEAALRVVADGGLRALTHRAVDARAALPEGSCSSYFRTRLALLTALTEQVGYVLTSHVLGLAERIQRVEGAGADQAAPSGQGDEVRRAAIIDEVVGLFEHLLAAPELVMVQAELSLEALRQPDLMIVLRPWQDNLLHIVESIVRDADKGEPEQRAVTLVAAMEGVVLSGLQQPEGERAAYLRGAIGMLLGGLY